MASSLRSEEIAKLSKLRGLDLLNGSLNLVGTSPVWLDTCHALYSSGKGNFYWEACLEGIPIILNRGGFPAHIFEVFSENHLRSVLNLQDGDVVTISIPLEIINAKENARLRNRMIWYAVWSRRETFYYKSDGYLAFLKLFGEYLWRSNQF